MAHRFRAIALLALSTGLLCGAAEAAPRTLRDYKHFRALSIDLVGRMPTRAEIAAFEQDDFSLDGWIDAKLRSPEYAERMRILYMDRLRLEVGTAFAFRPPALIIKRREILGPDGQPLAVYYRRGQRRVDEATDGTFCLTQEQTGLQFPNNLAARGTPKPVTVAALDAATVLVKPWWLYRDYRSPTPADRYGEAWATRFPGYRPVNTLLNGPDGTPVDTIRVCKEEAQTATVGLVYASGRRQNPPAGTPPPFGRVTNPPLDTTFARTHAGEPISCLVGSAFRDSATCGCGPGLERCLPGDSFTLDPRSFVLPTRAPLGFDRPFAESNRPTADWNRLWWAEEAVHFLDDVFLADRDFREMLTSPRSFVNGPLAQFYRSTAGLTCCGNGIYLDHTEPQPLFHPAALPALLPHDVQRWERVDFRGPQASGILTMPVFLSKYGTRRARAHLLYNAFLCKEFVAEGVELPPSNEPNLMVRPGCATCHATLEPLASYFTRIQESDWTYLPPENFPLRNPACAVRADGTLSGICRPYYDLAFSDADGGSLMGSYGSAANAEAGPKGLASYVTSHSEFGRCAARNVAEAFLGRSLTTDDEPLLGRLTRAFVDGGYRMRVLVGTLVRESAYRDANNLTSSSWREEAAIGGAGTAEPSATPSGGAP